MLVFQLQLDQTHLRLRGEFYVLRRRDSRFLDLSLNESACPDLEIYTIVTRLARRSRDLQDNRPAHLGELTQELP